MADPNKLIVGLPRPVARLQVRLKSLLSSHGCAAHVLELLTYTQVARSRDCVTFSRAVASDRLGHKPRSGAWSTLAFVDQPLPALSELSVAKHQSRIGIVMT
jgi:hypothetical protein